MNNQTVPTPLNSSPVQALTKRQKLWIQIKKHRFYYLLLLPGMLAYLIFRITPFFGVIIAFKDLSPFDGLSAIITGPWVGLKNFIEFFNSYYFWNILRNTLVLALLRMLTEFPLPIVLAILLNEVRSKHFKKTVQTISYMPYFVSTVVLAGLVLTLFSSSGGLVPAIVKFFGGNPQYYLGDPRYFRAILVTTLVWKNIGWSSVVYLAALSGVDPQLYEAAEIDGANKWQQIWKITLPSISYAIIIMLILRVGVIINEGFEETLLLYSPSVYSVGDLINTYVYRVGLEQMRYSFATAVGFFESLMGLTLVLITNYFSKKAGHEGIY